MRVVFAGTPEVALPSLEALLASPHEVVAVVTRPDAPAGRGRTLQPSPVARRAEELGIEVLKPEHPRDRDFQARLRELAPDACPVVAYGALLPQDALDIPARGWLNLHFSLLPAYRGAAPVQRALWAGEEMTGASVFRIVKELDAGPVFGVMTELVRPHDTSGDLLGRLAEGGAHLLVQVLSGIESGQIEAREQFPDGVSFAPKITVEDAQVDWTKPAAAIDRQVRACTPAPGAWTTLAGERLKLGPVVISPVASTDSGCAPAADSPSPLRGSDGRGGPASPLATGEILVTKRDVLVGTGSGVVRLGLVKAFGKKEMPAADWARGARIESGAVLGG